MRFYVIVTLTLLVLKIVSIRDYCPLLAHVLCSQIRLLPSPVIRCHQRWRSEERWLSPIADGKIRARSWSIKVRVNFHLTETFGKSDHFEVILYLSICRPSRIVQVSWGSVCNTSIHSCYIYADTNFSVSNFISVLESDENYSNKIIVHDRNEHFLIHRAMTLQWTCISW